jgi:Carbohydrate-selective porin, OprB family
VSVSRGLTWRSTAPLDRPGGERSPPWTKPTNTTYHQRATSLMEVQEAQRTHNHTRVVTPQAYFEYCLSLYQLELATGSRCVEPLRTRTLLTSGGCDARDHHPPRYWLLSVTLGGKFSRALKGQDFEMILEWTYEMALAPWLTLQPDMQYILKPSDTGDIPNTFVLGLQISLSL